MKNLQSTFFLTTLIESVRLGRGGFRCGRFVDEIGTAHWWKVSCDWCDENFAKFPEPITARHKTNWHAVIGQPVSGNNDVCIKKIKKKEFGTEFLKKNIVAVVAMQKKRLCLLFPGGGLLLNVRSLKRRKIEHFSGAGSLKSLA